MNAVFTFPLLSLQPSQLYINAQKLDQVLQIIDFSDPECLEPLSIKELGGKVILTDGHTRAVAAYMHGLRQIQVIWDEDDLDWEAYQICVDWCLREGVITVADLANRIIDDEAYQVRWIQRCEAMHQALASNRSSK